MGSKKTPKRRRFKKTKSVLVLAGPINQADIDTTFSGEMMKCVMCGTEQQSDPDVESDWRMIQIGNENYYVCPDELPPDGSSVEEYSQAYRTIGRRISSMRQTLFSKPMRN